MTICFETELKTEWPKILRTMRLLNKRNEASIHLWNFLEFVVTHRTALYIQVMPFIVHKIGQPPISEHERNMQSIIREKMSGERMAFPKSRGTLLGDLLHELRDLKEEIEDRKFGTKNLSFTGSRNLERNWIFSYSKFGPSEILISTSAKLSSFYVKRFFWLMPR